MSTHKATLANFTCTIKKDNTVVPMLLFFMDIIYPALSDTTIYRTTQKSTYYISDLKLVNLGDGNIALTGLHIKRTILDIHPDFDNKNGFKGETSHKPSAPYSTFIILLNNHRVIYYPCLSGAPGIRTFASTINHIIFTYVSKKRSELQSKLITKNIDNKREYIFGDETYTKISDFRKNVLDKKFPFPETNIVAIASDQLVIEAFEKLIEIKSVSFKFYKPNNEPLNFNNFFEKSYDMLNQTSSTSMHQIFNNPQNKEMIKNGVITSNGKTDYTINGISTDNEMTQIKPDTVSSKINIHVNDEDNVEKQTENVYNQLKNRSEIKEVSKQNLKLFNKIKSFIASFI